MDDIRLQNIENRLQYLTDKIQEIENQLGFKHSGIDSIKARLELLESYSIVNDHNEFNTLFADTEILSSGNLFCSYLKLKLKRMYEIVSLPPNLTRIRHEINEIYNFDRFPPYDKIENLFHQCQLLLLFISPSITSDFQVQILELIFRLRTCYHVTPGIIDWILEPNEDNLTYVKDNYEKIIEKLGKVE